MPTGRDDDALRWDGDDDPTLDVGSDAPASPAPAETAALPEGWNAVGRGSAGVERDAAPEDDSRPADVAAAEAPARERMGSAELISLGVLGGFSLLYAVGWLIGGLRLQDRLEYLVTDVMYQGALWLAVMAPLLWFVTVMVIARKARAWVRFAWLIAGIVVLVPWPFVMIGAVGQ